MTEPAPVTSPGLPARITYDQVVQALNALAPDLDPRNVQHVYVGARQVKISTWHADSPHERAHVYSIDHVQGAATEGSDQ